MKVDSSIYTRFPLDINSSQGKSNVEKNNKSQSQEQVSTANKSDTYERIAAKVNEIKAAQKAESDVPANLSDVLTREETQMLQSLFADFDIRPQPDSGDFSEESFYYYFRDQKSITRRVPEAFNCDGYYVEGNIVDTFKILYKKLMVL